MYSSKRAWKSAVCLNEKFKSMDRNSQHPRTDTDAEVAGLELDHSDTSEGIIVPGFYQPANCEDGDPLENEQKLLSFTGPLVGYEASGRVPVILKTVNRTGEKGHPRILDTVSEKSSHDVTLPGQESIRTLRATTSDLQLKKPLWAWPVRSRNIAPVAPLKIELPARSSPLIADTKDPQISKHESSPSSKMSTNSFGAIGGGRHGMWHNGSDPPFLTGIGLSSARRVSRAPLPTNPSSPDKYRAVEAVKLLFNQNHTRLATDTVNAIELAISKRQSSRYTLPVSNADQDVNRANSWTNAAKIHSNPRIFSLPSGTVVFVIKSDDSHDIEVAINNGVWCSSPNGNRALDSAWRHRKPGQEILLLFSVVKSSQYCGLAEMTGPYNEDARPDIFSGKDRQGIIPIRWIVVKSVAFKHFENLVSLRLLVNGLRNASMVPDDTAQAMIQIYLIAPSEALVNMKLDYPVSRRAHLHKQSGADHRRSGRTVLSSKHQPNIPQSDTPFTPASDIPLLSKMAVSQPPRRKATLPSAPAKSLSPGPDEPLPSGPQVALPTRSNAPLQAPFEHVQRAIYVVHPEHIRTNPSVHDNRNVQLTPTGPSNLSYRQSNFGRGTGESSGGT